MALNDQDAPRTIAVFVDLENVAIGVGDARLRTFDMSVVMERLLEKGNVVVRRAYADFGKLEKYKRPLHEHGVELLDMPGSKITGKNSADIKMVVDALELSYTKPHIDTFAVVSGDSDFGPLVSKLRENARHTIGIGVKSSTSPMLIDACDEFILYDDLVRKPRKKRGGSGMSKLPEKKREAFDHLLAACSALQREGRTMYGGLVKETIRRKQPQFNEEYYGYGSFSKLLQDAEKNKLVKLRKDAKSGTWVVDDVGEEG